MSPPYKRLPLERLEACLVAGYQSDYIEGNLRVTVEVQKVRRRGEQVCLHLLVVDDTCSRDKPPRKGDSFRAMFRSGDPCCYIWIPYDVGYLRWRAARFTDATADTWTLPRDEATTLRYVDPSPLSFPQFKASLAPGFRFDYAELPNVRETVEVLQVDGIYLIAVDMLVLDATYSGDGAARERTRRVGFLAESDPRVLWSYFSEGHFRRRAAWLRQLPQA